MRKLIAVGALALLTAGVTSSSSGANPAPSAKRKPAANKPTAKRCASGATPIVTRRGGKLVLKRDRRGRLSCKPLKRSSLKAPSATPTRQVGQVADMLASSATVDPRALARLERAIGPRRTQRLLALALQAWRAPAGAARDAGARAAASGSSSFGTEGAGGSVSFGVEEVGGAQRGFTATASAELKVTRAELEKSASAAVKENLPADVTGATAKVDVSFTDVTAKCPDAKGAVAGKLRGKGSIKVTVERAGAPPTELTLSAEVSATYEAQVGPDGTVSAVNDLDVRTTFQAGGTGKSTETYRGRRLGTGFGRAGILGADNFSAAYERDAALINPNRGGIFGPHTAWNFERGIDIGDLRTLDNVKAMVTAAVATNLLTLAAVEYLRKVTLKRIDENPCKAAYEVTLAVNSRGSFATHEATGTLNVSVTAAPAPGSAKPITSWTGSAPSPFEGLTFTTKIPPCVYVSPITKGTFTVNLELTPSGSLKVTWSSDASSTASVDCPPEDGFDPPPIPGQVGPALLGNITPMTFELPATGGSQPITGGFSDGGDGFFNDGTLTVKRLD